MPSFQESLIIEGNLFNVVSWTSGVVGDPWKLHYFINGIKHLSLSLKVESQHVLLPTNEVAMANRMAKEGHMLGMSIVFFIVVF